MSFSGRNLPVRRNPFLLEGLPPCKPSQGRRFPSPPQRPPTWRDEPSSRLTSVADIDITTRRKLGRSQLLGHMVPGTDPDRIGAIGSFDYAHLRAPLPRNVKSDMFPSGSRGGYYLMRRSADGMVSASGMFKTAFPWATKEQEEVERRHVQSLPGTCQDELAFSVWIDPEQAVTLGEEYGMGPWIRALLDPAAIPAVTSNQNVENGAPRRVRAPPLYFGGSSMSASSHATPLPTTSSVPRPSSRSRRSASPMKPSFASPSKRGAPASRKRKTLAAAAASQSTVPADAMSPSASSSLFDDETPFSATGSPSSQLTGSTTVEIAVMHLDTLKTEPVSELPPVPEMPLSEDAAENAMGEESENQEDEVAFAGEPPSPDEMKQVLAKAAQMVATSPENSSSIAETKSKRKAEGTARDQEGKSGKKAAGNNEDHNGDADGDTSAEPAVKKVKTEKTEVRLRKDRIKKRAFYGIGATLAVG